MAFNQNVKLRPTRAIEPFDIRFGRQIEIDVGKRDRAGAAVGIFGLRAAASDL